MTADPWATPDNPLGSQAPQPKWTTRADLVELAARALMGYPADRPWSEDDLAAIETMGFEQSTRDIFVDLAAEALDATYPSVVNAEEIEALGWQTVIVNGQGRVMRREIAPDNRLDHGGKPWSQPGGEMGRHRVGYTSADLAVSGPWTVVHRRSES